MTGRVKQRRGIIRVMKKASKRIFRGSGFWLALIIIVQTIIYIVAGMDKAYFHMDEIYSYGLANYDRVQIYETEGFYDQWHKGEYYDDYLTVDEGERGDFRPVYENQKNDVHPPLFYGLLRLGMELAPGKFSKWTGIGLNIVIFAVNTVLIYLIISRLWQVRTRAGRRKSLILTLVIGVGVASVSTVIYIRMYALLTLWITLTTYLHLRLLEKDRQNADLREYRGLWVGIGIVALLGILTQYYYLFFIVAMYVLFSVRYLRAKQTKKWRLYTLVLGVSAAISLIIWPFSIQHMLFSNRGGGVIEHLLNPRLLVENIWQYFEIIDLYVFHDLLLIILAVLMGAGAYLLSRKNQAVKRETKSVRGAEASRGAELVTILAPAGFYFAIVAAVSPFIALRYVAPVCGLVIILVAFFLDWLMEQWIGERRATRILAGVAVVFLAMPIVLQIKPDVSYDEYRGAIEAIQEKKDVPMLYLFKTGDDWVVLNDLLLLREIDQSYLAQDVQTAEEMSEILAEKDLKGGLLLFINDGQDKDDLVEEAMKATKLSEVTHLWRMPTSDVYYLH